MFVKMRRDENILKEYKDNMEFLSLKLDFAS